MLIFAQIENDVADNGGNPLIALAFIVGGLVVGSLLAGATRRVMSAENRPAPIRSAAGAISTVVFSVILIVALITALGIVSPSSLDKLEDDLLDFIPRALAAAIVLIIANVVAQLVETAASGALAHASPMLRQRVPAAAKFGILAFAAVIAANQLGIDTTIITIVVASLFFSIGLSAALLAGLGGRKVASELAAGRALRQVLGVGDAVTAENINGVVAAIGSTTTQITTPDRVLLVPNAELLSATMSIVPADTNEEHDDKADQ